jgi:hypothetical protein
MTEFTYFFTATLLLYMAMLLFGGMASAFLRGTKLPLQRGQSINFGGKRMEYATVHIIVHEIAFFLTDQQPGVTQNLKVL